MALTGPEMFAERRICERIRAQIRSDPCAHCVHRVDGWGKAACSLIGRQYPACMTDGRHLSFELDEKTLKRAA